MRTYNVHRREPIVRFLEEALAASGIPVISKPNPKVAPFVFDIELPPQGEPLRLICYAFLANKYRQSRRPLDEHRFQIKYGSDFHEYHELEISPDRSRQVTLFLGVHLEEGLLIGCDPVMHNPTWFSKSVEFKTEDLEQAQRTGWHGWERERSPGGRRKQSMPRLNFQVEALIAFKPQNFLRYIRLERLATGLDPGERLLIAEKLVESSRELHPLEVELGLSYQEILDMIEDRFRLKAGIRGGAAEWHLQSYLKEVPGVTKVLQIDEDGKPDFEVTYKRRSKAVTLECKNVLRTLTKNNLPRVDFQKTRASKGNPCSRYYTPRQFDILAACLHPIKEAWEYQFIPVASLAPHKKCQGHLSERVFVGESPDWLASVEELLDRLSREG